MDIHKNLHIVALIPARSGSKGLIDKNIRKYKHLPLIAHSINVGCNSRYIKTVYFSSDSEKYNDIARIYGAKIVGLRPPEISDDLSPDIDTFNFFLSWLKDNKMPKPDLIVHLRPTYPNRSADLLDKCIENFIYKYDKYDSLRTVVPFEKCPYKMYYIDRDRDCDDGNNMLIPFIKHHEHFIEPFNQARQNFPQAYIHNGCIDIIKTECLEKNNLLSGTRILPFIMDKDEINDIDNEYDFILSENAKII